MLATLVASAALAITPNVEAAREYAAERPGTVAFAVRTEDALLGRATKTASFPSATRAEGDAARRLRRRTRATGRCARDERALLAPMVRRSDNAAANAIFTRSAPPGLERLARDGGHDALQAGRRRSGATRGSRRATRPGSSCASTRCCRPATAPTGCGCCGRSSRASAGGSGGSSCPDWRVYFKGGWGSGTGAVDHQVALLRRGEERIAIAVLTANNGSPRRRQADARGRLPPPAARGWRRPTQGLLGAARASPDASRAMATPPHGGPNAPHAKTTRPDDLRRPPSPACSRPRDSVEARRSAPATTARAPSRRTPTATASAMSKRQIQRMISSYVRQHAAAARRAPAGAARSGRTRSAGRRPDRRARPGRRRRARGEQAVLQDATCGSGDQAALLRPRHCRSRRPALTDGVDAEPAVQRRRQLVPPVRGGRATPASCAPSSASTANNGTVNLAAAGTLPAVREDRVGRQRRRPADHQLHDRCSTRRARECLFIGQRRLNGGRLGAPSL